MTVSSVSIRSWSKSSQTLLKGERVLTHSIAVGGGAIAAGRVGAPVQSLVSHQHRPADFGRRLRGGYVLYLVEERRRHSVLIQLLAPSKANDRAVNEW